MLGRVDDNDRENLMRGADLFVQNFRPGVADRMGIGEAALRRIKPNLVYVSISGFGESGPYVHKRVYDPVIQALSGLASIQGDPVTGRPRMIRLIVPDKVTAALMGHSNVYTTLNVYTPVVDDSKKTAAERIGNELFSIVQFSGVADAKGGIDSSPKASQANEVVINAGS